MALLSYALTTVARQKVFLSISGSSYDTLLETIINSCTDWIEKYCDRRFLQTAYSQEVYNGSGSPTLMLNNFPISTTASFTLEKRTTNLNENTWDSVDTNVYFIHYNKGYLEMVGYSNLSFVSTDKFLELPRHYRVSYTAGYNYDNAATFLSDVGAADLELACWKLVGAVYKLRTTSGNTQSESIGDYSITFTREMSLDDEIASILNRYRRIPG